MNGRAPAPCRTPQEGEAEAFEPESIQARLLELGREVPTEEWANIPRDGSRNLDNYLYGVRRQP